MLFFIFSTPSPSKNLVFVFAFFLHARERKKLTPLYKQKTTITDNCSNDLSDIHSQLKKRKEISNSINKLKRTIVQLSGDIDDYRSDILSGSKTIHDLRTALWYVYSMHEYNGNYSYFFHS